MNQENTLFTPYKLNQHLTLKNKIVMAPMTRVKATEQLIPTADMAEYYARRAAAGLVITEGTVIMPSAVGYTNVPGIFTTPQVEAWKQTTTAVHNAGGLIFSQIWHVGRVSHPNFLNGELPISASETMMSNRIARMENLSYGKSRAASLSEIKEIIRAYETATKNAIEAGFDGIEIHAANGYLIDQFLHHDTNKRQDEYGGNAQKMARFSLDVVNACGETIGYERVGIRLSPGAYLNEIIGQPEDAEVFAYLLEELNHLPLAYVHTGNFDDSKLFPELNNMTMTAFIRAHYRGVVIASGGYTQQSAEQGIKNNDFDLVAFGKPFIANPDLVHRLMNNEPLKQYDVSMLQTLF